MSAVMLAIENDDERAALLDLQNRGFYLLDDGILASVADADEAEAAAAKILTLARIWRLADDGAGMIDDEMLLELRQYRQYCEECVEDDSNALERLRTTRDPGWSTCPDVDEGIRRDEEQVDKRRGELAVVDALLGRLGGLVVTA